MAFELATNVDPYGADLPSVQGSRVVASAPLNPGAAGRLRLRFSNKGTDGRVGREANEDMNVVGEYGLSMDSHTCAARGG